MDLETAALLKIGTWVLGLFGGASALENMLENYLMDKVPQNLKGFVVPVISFVFAVVSALYGGLPWEQAISAGFAVWGVTTTLHNHPATTSASWALPPPPADALGVPGVK